VPSPSRPPPDRHPGNHQHDRRSRRERSPEVLTTTRTGDGPVATGMLGPLNKLAQPMAIRNTSAVLDARTTVSPTHSTHTTGLVDRESSSPWQLLFAVRRSRRPHASNRPGKREMLARYRTNRRGAFDLCPEVPCGLRPTRYIGRVVGLHWAANSSLSSNRIGGAPPDRQGSAGCFQRYRSASSGVEPGADCKD
jgi:hypothetical protein